MTGDLIQRHGVHTLAYLAAMTCLLWPAIVNSQYIFFYDTTAYLRSAIQAFHVFGVETDWSALYNAPPPGSNDPSASADSVAAAPHTTTDGFISAARSIYYGAILYVAELFGSLWFGLLLQAIAVGLTVYLTIHAVLRRSRLEVPAALCFLGVFTPLSFFASYLMPDVFAGITILACAALLIFFDRLEWSTRGLWFGLLAVSLIVHTSHIAIALILALVGIPVVRFATQKVPWKATAAISAALGVGLLSQALFFWTVETVYGHSPLRPPFLMARAIADGPGYDYLRATCPENGFKICEFLPVLPLSSDKFLWSKDPAEGVVGPADPQTRRALVQEQTAFVAEVLRYDFRGQLTASFNRFLDQLSRFSIREFRYTPSLRKMVIENLPEDHRAAFRNSLLYRDAFPLASISALLHISAAVTLLFLIWGLGKLASNLSAEAVMADTARKSYKTLLLFSIIVLIGLAVNAAVTGVLSAPHDRYQARVIWLIPFLASLVFLAVRRQHRAMPELQKKATA